MGIIVVNFKNYKKGKEVLKLAKKIERYLPKAIVAVPAAQIEEVADETKLAVYAQHVDFMEKRRNTGFLLPEAVKKAGAKGSLLNHSEHPLSKTDIYKTLVVCKKFGLKCILFVGSLRGMKGILNIKKVKPWAIAFEDPKLVGTGRSITKYKANDIRKFVDTLKGTKIVPLCGVGISSADDVKEARKLGCKGVAVSSVVAKSKNPERFLKNA